MSKKLITYAIENKSGLKLTSKHITLVKSHSIAIVEGTVGGDAPKDLIKLYTYGDARKSDIKNWKKYIAKIGHKWYPNESITEHYLTTVGKCFGITIANSKIIIAEDVIRYLSEHFHKDEQTLNHGANILSRYLDENDNQWIDDLDRTKALKRVIDVEMVLEAIKKIFPVEHLEIFNCFFHMILFDTLTGNNDRHYYNWGVITHIKTGINLIFLLFTIVLEACCGTYLMRKLYLCIRNWEIPTINSLLTTLLNRYLKLVYLVMTSVTILN